MIPIILEKNLQILVDFQNACTNFTNYYYHLQWLDKPVTCMLKGT